MENNLQSIHVTIKNKDGNIYDDDVTALTSINDVGVFDILPLHANFISLIKNKIIVHKKNDSREFQIGYGVLQVKNDSVTIFLGL